MILDERICLLNHEFIPEIISNPEPIVGNAANQPGNVLFLSMFQAVRRIIIRPLILNKFTKIFYFILKLIIAINPPIAICQNLLKGK
jgi:hypothetical protein